MPLFWLKSRVVLLNKGNPDVVPELDNTRPISITPSVFKLFELSIVGQLRKYIDPVVSENQRGFVAGGETLMNIRELLKNAKRERSEFGGKEKAMLLFVDLRKAFDRVERATLLKKLDKIGVPGNLTSILEFIYSNTEVTVDGSLFLKTNRGLLQGSCLSPILFNLYIHDLLLDMRSMGCFTRALPMT